MTQWNTSMAGATGLRYEVLPFLLRLEQVPRSDWPDVMQGIQIIESEILRLWRQQTSN